MAIEHRTRRPVRQEPHTIDGITHVVNVELPPVPRDWDHLALRSAVTVVVAVLVAAMAWSTASIGALLAIAAPAVIAYAAAGVFDATWIVALIAEWLGRYDRARAAYARKVGHVALGIAMGAILAHGYVFGSVWAGAFGACISAAAKVGVTLLMKAIARPLDPRTAQWVEAETNAANARLAMIPVRRHLARAQAALAAEAAALAPATTYAPPAPRPAVDHTARHADATVRAAVRAAADTMPDATAEQLVDQLAILGIPTDVTTVHAAIPTAPKRPARHEDVVRKREDVPEDAFEDDLRTPIPTGSESIADTVRRLLDSGITDLNRVVLGVEAEHGPTSRKTVSNARNFALKTAAKA